MTKDDAEAATPGTATLVFVGLVWVGTTMFAARAAITGSAEQVSGALGAAAAALPGVVAATLLAGASVGAAAARRSKSAGGRLGAGLAMGTLLGLAAAAGIRFAYGGGILLLVLTIAASVVGGALAVLPRDALKAGLWGTTGVFLAGVIFGVVQPDAVQLLGSGEAANARFAWGQSLATGLVAAFCALPFLGAAGRRVPWYLVAGALPGLVLLGAEWLTRAGGAAAAGLVHGFRTGSPALVELSEAARVRHALVVLATGGLVAILVGALKSLARRSRPSAVPTPSSVDAFHQSLARIGLDAGEAYGFALAGGYAVRAAGFLTRPTEDVDLFTAWDRRSDFDTAARAIVDAYRVAGLTVAAERRHDTFTRLTVTDGVQSAKVDLGVDPRINDPVRTSVGPVLHPDDVIANKMRALYERGFACDFIDVDAALRSGRYNRSTLLQLAQQTDITFDGRVFADALARVQQVADTDFASYGLAGGELDSLRERFAAWRAALLNTARPMS